MLLFEDKPLRGHLEDRENYLVFTQTISRLERKISLWRNLSKKHNSLSRTFGEDS